MNYHKESALSTLYQKTQALWRSWLDQCATQMPAGPSITPKHRLGRALAHFSTLFCCPLIQECCSKGWLGKHSYANRNRILMS